MTADASSSRAVNDPRRFCIEPPVPLPSTVACPRATNNHRGAVPHPAPSMILGGMARNHQGALMDDSSVSRWPLRGQETKGGVKTFSVLFKITAIFFPLTVVPLLIDLDQHGRAPTTTPWRRPASGTPVIGEADTSNLPLMLPFILLFLHHC